MSHRQVNRWSRKIVWPEGRAGPQDRPSKTQMTEMESVWHIVRQETFAQVSEACLQMVTDKSPPREGALTEGPASCRYTSASTCEANNHAESAVRRTQVP